MIKQSHNLNFRSVAFVSAVSGIFFSSALFSVVGCSKKSSSKSCSGADCEKKADGGTVSPGGKKVEPNSGGLQFTNVNVLINGADSKLYSARADFPSKVVQSSDGKTAFVLGHTFTGFGAEYSGFGDGYISRVQYKDEDWKVTGTWPVVSVSAAAQATFKPSDAADLATVFLKCNYSAFPNLAPAVGNATELANILNPMVTDFSKRVLAPQLLEPSLWRVKHNCVDTQVTGGSLAPQTRVVGASITSSGSLIFAGRTELGLNRVVDGISASTSHSFVGMLSADSIKSFKAIGKVGSNGLMAATGDEKVLDTASSSDGNALLALSFKTAGQELFVNEINSQLDSVAFKLIATNVVTDGGARIAANKNYMFASFATVNTSALGSRSHIIRSFKKEGNTFTNDTTAAPLCQSSVAKMRNNDAARVERVAQLVANETHVAALLISRRSGERNIGTYCVEIFKIEADGALTSTGKFVEDDQTFVTDVQYSPVGLANTQMSSLQIQFDSANTILLARTQRVTDENTRDFDQISFRRISLSGEDLYTKSGSFSDTLAETDFGYENKADARLLGRFAVSLGSVISSGDKSNVLALIQEEVSDGKFSGIMTRLKSFAFNKVKLDK